ncbi:MAG: ATP-binding cassette domain-containing protein [Desulfuromonadaceae bacterium]|nr:ATP-binding cassette domain-containing protein [Desulfuromonadaceae bacterium]
MTAPLLEARNLSLQRGGVDVLKKVSLTIQENDVQALIGSNGSGKTSLLLAFARLLPISRGELLVKGETIHGEQAELAYRRRISIVFQEPLLLDASVAANVAAGLSLRKTPRQEQQERVDEALEMFNIAGLSRRSAHTLSSGEARRVSLARAFAIRPELIFLDEPFTALDLPLRETLFSLLARLLSSNGITAVIATHDCREVLQLCNKVAVMKKGHLIGSGTPADVLADPPDDFSAAFARHAHLQVGRSATTEGHPCS